MTVRVKLAAFAVVLAATFGTGFGLGALTGEGDADPVPHSPGQEHGR